MSTEIEPHELAVRAAAASVEATTDFTSAVEHPASEPRQRRHRLAFWSATVLALVALVGGSVLTVRSYQSAMSPRSVVEAYLTTLAAGDAPGALAFGRLPDGQHGLLTAEVLAAQLAIASISDVTVTGVREAGPRASVDVSYSLGFATGAVSVTDAIDVIRDGRRWQLDAVAVPVTIQLAAARSRSSFVGGDVPVGRHLLFPGALPVAFDTENLTLPAESRVVRFAEATDLPEEVELTEAGMEAVGAALDEAMSACLDGTAEIVTLCPLPADARAVPGSVRGTVVEPASSVVPMRVQPGPDGLVQIEGQVEVSGEYQQLDFNNRRVTETGEFFIRVVAACYVTEPDTIVWRSL